MQIGEVPASSMRLDKSTKEQEVQGPNAGALHYLDIKDLREKNSKRDQKGGAKEGRGKVGQCESPTTP